MIDIQGIIDTAKLYKPGGAYGDGVWVRVIKGCAENKTLSGVTIETLGWTPDRGTLWGCFFDPGFLPDSVIEELFSRGQQEGVDVWMDEEHELLRSPIGDSWAVRRDKTARPKTVLGDSVH